VPHDLPGTDIHGFAMSPDDPNRLYASVVGHGILRSVDGGEKWERLSGGVPGDLMALASTGGSPDTLFAGSMSSGVLMSSDGGQGWIRAGFSSDGVMALAVSPKAQATVYAGTGGGLYKSADGGASWAKLPLPGTNVAAVAVSPAQPNRLLAIAVKDRQGQVFRSEDGGATWGGQG
jgi:photosystem II stability/assembly factor-like uncharacterized protein